MGRNPLTGKGLTHQPRMEVTGAAGLNAAMRHNPSWSFSEERIHCQTIYLGAKTRAEGPGQHSGSDARP